MRAAFGLSLLLAALGPLAGCAARGHVATPAEMAGLRASSGLTASGKITLRGPRGRFSTRVLFGVDRAGSLRLEIPAGAGLRFLLVCRGDRLRAELPQEGASYEGEASAEVMSRLFGIDLAPRDLANAILGEAAAEVDARWRFDRGQPAALSLRRGETSLPLTLADPETEAPGPDAFALRPIQGALLSLDDMAARLGLTR